YGWAAVGERLTAFGGPIAIGRSLAVVVRLLSGNRRRERLPRLHHVRAHYARLRRSDILPFVHGVCGNEEDAPRREPDRRLAIDRHLERPLEDVAELLTGMRMPPR